MTDDEFEQARWLRAGAVENAFVRAVEALNEGSVERARALAVIAETLARVAKAASGLEAPPATPEPPAKPFLPLVQHDQGQAGGGRDQATFHVNIGTAKASFSRLITHALNGDNVVVCRDGNPVVRLVPYERALAAPAANASETLAQSSGKQ